MLCGIPASGKSSIAKELALEYGAIIHSSDAIRKELYGDESIQGNKNDVFEELYRKIKADLKNGKSIILDACNVQYRRRMAFLNEMRRYKARRICYLVMKSYERCLEDNRHRDRMVPEHVIKNMHEAFYIPQKYEGWDKIHVIYCDGDSVPNFASEMKFYNTYDQQNSHHSLTLGEHMKECARYVVAHSNKNTSSNLPFAALYHDCGKPETATIMKKSGEIDTELHYYSHNNVSAYKFMLMSRDEIDAESALEMANFIQHHMRPYEIAKNGGKEKFVRMVGQRFYDDLMLLHEADKSAH